jgi:hypothetical protein
MLQRPVHGAFTGDLDKLVAQTLIDLSLDRDHPLEPVNLATSPFGCLTAI